LTASATTAALFVFGTGGIDAPIAAPLFTFALFFDIGLFALPCAKRCLFVAL
jgi:hypothetical protein